MYKNMGTCEICKKDFYRCAHTLQEREDRQNSCKTCGLIVPPINKTIHKNYHKRVMEYGNDNLSN